MMAAIPPGQDGPKPPGAARPTLEREAPVGREPAPEVADAGPTPLEFDSVRDTEFAHGDARLDAVLHIFHLEWHGIRSACAALPGHKLGIPHEGALQPDFFRHALGLIFRHRITRVCLQGVSDNAIRLAAAIKAEFADHVALVAVTHVNCAQFEYGFELDMQRLLTEAQRSGIFSRIASVKPDFHEAIDAYWPETIYNCAPKVGEYGAAFEPDLRSVFVPLAKNWRKNLFTNALAACRSAEVDVVFTVNRPSKLEHIADMTKLNVCGYLRGMNLYSFMGTVGCVLNATLAECQPMVQLEALAMGTPCITGPLLLPDLLTHPLTELTEVAGLDSPRQIRRALEAVLRERRRDPTGFQAMIGDYLDSRRALCLDSYLRLLDV